MDDATLFPRTAGGPKKNGKAQGETSSTLRPRLRRPDRLQMILDPVCLDDRLPGDHPARTIWSVVERLDLSGFYEPLKARGPEPGRAATDPKLLIGLWLYGATQGVGSGRELARLCEYHDAYRWLCGGVSLNYHTLNDFRVGYEAALDELFTQVLATLVYHEVVTVRRISQDGTRVRASAGSSSFRRHKTLKKQLNQTKRHIEALKRQMDPEVSARQHAAQERAARDRQRRLEAALAQLPKIQASKAKQKNKPSKHRPPRVSSTDPQARVMRMSDGGYRPAYNVQLATDTASRAIVGVDVINIATDANESVPMRRQVEQRTRLKVQEHLMDGGFVALHSIEQAQQDGVKVYGPPPVPKKAATAYTRRTGDSEAIAAWR